MDGGVREKQKTEAIKAEVNKQRKRGRPKLSGRRQNISALTSPQSPDLRPPTPRLSISSIDEHVEVGVGLSSMLPTPDGENADFAEAHGATGPKSPVRDNNISELITISDNTLWSTTAYAASQPISTHAALDPMTDASFAVEFGSGGLDSPWNFFAEPDVPSVITPIAVTSPIAPLAVTSSIAPVAVSSSNLILDMVGTTSIDHATTFEQSCGSIVDLSRPNQKVVNDEPNMTYYVNHVIPSIFPFLNPQLQLTLRTKLLTYDTSNASIRSSTLAHCLVLQKVGLERVGLSSDASAEKMADLQRSEAIEQVRNLLREIHQDEAHIGKGADASVALCVLQLALLHVSIKQISVSRHC